MKILKATESYTKGKFYGMWKRKEEERKGESKEKRKQEFEGEGEEI